MHQLTARAEKLLDVNALVLLCNWSCIRHIRLRSRGIRVRLRLGLGWLKKKQSFSGESSSVQFQKATEKPFVVYDNDQSISLATDPGNPKHELLQEKGYRKLDPSSTSLNSQKIFTTVQI